MLNATMEEELVAKYEQEFREKTGKNLCFFIVKKYSHREIDKIKPIISLEKILEFVNNEIPNELKAKYKTIIHPTRIQEIVNLRKIFTVLTLKEGHSKKDIVEIMKMERTSLIHHVNCINDAFKVKIGYEQLLESYRIIFYKIQQEHASIIQSDNNQQTQSQSGLSVTLYSKPITAETNQREYGIERTGTGLGESTDKYANIKIHRVLEAS